jgi:integrase
MSVYRKKGSTVWTMDFQFQGQRIKESTGVHNKTVALRIERARRTELEEGRAGVSRPTPTRLFQAIAGEYIDAKRAAIPQAETRGAASTVRIDEANLKHLLPVFAKTLVCDIAPNDIAYYQKQRLEEGARPKTVNLEMGTFRSILNGAGHWARLSTRVRMLPIDDEVGRSLSTAEIDALLEACSLSESRLLYPIVFLLLETGSRSGTVLALPWGDVDFEGRGLRWGRDKTKAGSGRTVPISQRAMAMLEVWRENFPDRQPAHFVFPRERYTQPKDRDRATRSPYRTDPTHPVRSVQHSWETAQQRTAWILAGRPESMEGVPEFHCRFHDLRHTACTRMITEKVPIPVIAQLVGWSPTTMWAMAQKYGHYDQETLRRAVESISAGSGSPLKSHPFTPRHLAQNLQVDDTN